MEVSFLSGCQSATWVCLVQMFWRWLRASSNWAGHHGTPARHSGVPSQLRCCFRNISRFSCKSIRSFCNRNNHLHSSSSRPTTPSPPDFMGMQKGRLTMHCLPQIKWRVWWPLLPNPYGKLGLGWGWPRFGASFCHPFLFFSNVVMAGAISFGFDESERGSHIWPYFFRGSLFLPPFRLFVLAVVGRVAYFHRRCITALCPSLAS